MKQNVPDVRNKTFSQKVQTLFLYHQLQGILHLKFNGQLYI